MSVSKVRVRSPGDTKREGFWRSPEDPTLPSPVANDRPWKGKSELLTRLKKIQSRAEGINYKGWSTCRVCNCRNGSVTFKYKGWSWPSGFIHYIEKHNVEPTDAFKKFINSFFTEAADPAGAIDKKMRNRPGTIKERKAYKEHLELMKKAQSSSEWLTLLDALFFIPQRAVFHAAEFDPSQGYQQEGKWKVDTSSTLSTFSMRKRPDSDIAKTMPSAVRAEFANLFDAFESGQCKAVTHITGSCNLVITLDLVSGSTGSDPYKAMCFRPITAQFASLKLAPDTEEGEES